MCAANVETAFDETTVDNMTGQQVLARSLIRTLAWTRHDMTSCLLPVRAAAHMGTRLMTRVVRHLQLFLCGYHIRTPSWLHAHRDALTSNAIAGPLTAPTIAISRVPLQWVSTEDASTGRPPCFANLTELAFGLAVTRTAPPPMAFEEVTPTGRH